MITSRHLRIKWILTDKNGEVLHIASGTVKGLSYLASQEALKPFLAAYPETVQIETLLVLEKRYLEDIPEEEGI